MPSQAFLIRQEMQIGGAKQFTASDSLKQESFLAGLLEAVGGDQHPKVVGNGPEAVVKQPVCGFVQRNSVRRVIAAALRQLMDVCGIQGSLAVDRNHPVTGQRASI